MEQRARAISNPNGFACAAVNFVLLGPSECGKTALARRFTSSIFGEDDETPKRTTKLWSKDVGAPGAIVRIRIWDVEGSASVERLAMQFCKKADAVCICFDVNQSSSFHSAMNLADRVSILLENELSIQPQSFFIGCKADSAAGTARQVTTFDIQQEMDRRDSSGCYYFETSALCGRGVDFAFVVASRSLLSGAVKTRHEYQLWRGFFATIDATWPDSTSYVPAHARVTAEIEEKGEEFADKKRFWRSDSDVSVCQLCKSPFNWKRRKHHCRRCGEVFCKHCSSHTRLLPGGTLAYPVRVCDTCAKAMDH